MSQPGNGNGVNGNGVGALDPRLPTLEELKRAYDEGLEQTLLSGLKVKLRPLQPDKLLLSGTMPDVLTPMVMGMLFPPATEDDAPLPDEVDNFLFKQREQAQEAAEYIRAVDAVCAAALVDPSLVPYLSLQDRIWVFKLAFMPVAVLSTFRLGQKADVEPVADEPGEPHAAERADAGDGVAVPVESADRVQP